MHAHRSFTLAPRLLRRIGALVAGLLVAAATQAAAPGIAGSSFDLVAAEGQITQPDGASIYSWGFGCNTEPDGSNVSFVPAAIGSARCPAGTMQLPGPTLVVTQGQTVTVTLHNNLPRAAGNTSIVFPGFQVAATAADPGVSGLLAQEAVPGGTVTYSFVADTPGTHSYHSGTQPDLQIEMGLYGALVVLPNSTANSSQCVNAAVQAAQKVKRAGYAGAPSDFRLAGAAYDHAAACYDREYLFQFSEIDPRIHQQAKDQVRAGALSLTIQTEPYHAVYFMVNGRSMPDDMDPNYAPQYPNQPYNGNPHMHPGEMTLVRVVEQGRMQHPFHEHANHLRLLARDGQLLLNGNGRLSGPLLFTTTSNPGQSMDLLFQYTARNLNWDIYGHGAGIAASGGDDDFDPAKDCDANGYYTKNPAASNFFEWCGDHKKPLESKPFGNVGSGGPVTLPDPNILVNGAWYGGSPYFGPDATARAVGPTPIPPFGTIANDPGAEAGFAFMWHSHNEREITTNNIFPGGLMMMMLVDPWVFLIDESN